MALSRFTIDRLSDGALAKFIEDPAISDQELEWAEDEIDRRPSPQDHPDSPSLEDSHPSAPHFPPLGGYSS